VGEAIAQRSRPPRVAAGQHRDHLRAPLRCRQRRTNGRDWGQNRMRPRRGASASMWRAREDRPRGTRHVHPHRAKAALGDHYEPDAGNPSIALLGLVRCGLARRGWPPVRASWVHQSLASSPAGSSIATTSAVRSMAARRARAAAPAAFMREPERPGAHPLERPSAAGPSRARRAGHGPRQSPNGTESCRDTSREAVGHWLSIRGYSHKGRRRAVSVSARAAEPGPADARVLEIQPTSGARLTAVNSVAFGPVTFTIFLRWHAVPVKPDRATWTFAVPLHNSWVA
jgi:hypothetical protein